MHDKSLELVDLERRLAALAKRAAVVEGSCRQSAELLGAGCLPPDNLPADLTAFRDAFMGLAQDIRNIAQESVPTIDPGALDPGAHPSLRTLGETLTRVGAAQQQQAALRQQARAVLEDVLSLSHAVEPHFGPLLTCHSQARALLTDCRDEILTELARGSHPMAHLVRWVCEQDALSDEEWETLRDSVTKSWGCALATSVSRGKLLLLRDAIAEESTPISATTSAAEPAAQPPLEPATTPPPVDVAGLPIEPALAPVLDIVTSPSPEPEPAADPVSGPEVNSAAAASAAAPVGTASIETAPPSSRSRSSLTPAVTAPDSASSTDPAGARLNVLAQDLWGMVCDSRYALAYQYARSLETAEIQSAPPSWVLHALVLSRSVRHDNGELARLLRDDFSQFRHDCFARLHKSWERGLTLMLIAAALRPALLAPSTSAPAILRNLSPIHGMEVLTRYSEVIAHYSEHQRALDLGALRGVRDQAIWQQELDKLRQEASDWLTLAPTMTNLYAPATKVWVKWLERGGLIQRLLAPVLENDVGRIDFLNAEIGRLSDDKEIRRAIANTDRKELKRVGKDIEARAIPQILRHVRHALDLTRRYVELQQAALNRPQDYLFQLAQSLRRDVDELGPRALEELSLQDFEEDGEEPFAWRAGLHTCRSTIVDIQQLFSPSASLPPVEEPEVRCLVNVDLLKVPGLRVDESWDLVGMVDPSWLIEQLQSLGSPGPTWTAAFDARMEEDDHEATGYILEYLARHSVNDVDLESLRGRRNRRMDERRDMLRRMVGQVRTAVDGAVMLGQLREEERTEYLATIESIDGSLGSMVQFREPQQRLDRITQEIHQRQQQSIAVLRQRMDLLGAVTRVARERIELVLTSCDVLTANEYIGLLEQGLPLPEPISERDYLADFFPHAARAIWEFMENPEISYAAILGMLRDKKEFCGLSLARMPGPHLEQASRMLESWFVLKRQRNVDEQAIREILSALGFPVLSVRARRQVPEERGVLVNVETKPIQDRNRILVSAYGSAATGRYRLLAVWDRPGAEDLLSMVSDFPAGPPILVFYFGRFSDKLRREMASLCRVRRRTLLVVDDTLMIFLCGVLGSRLRALFDCTLPFTFISEAYSTTAGLVPPEMFYGRSREIESITHPMGSCFIYGGRQLGKTALLRHVERSFNDALMGHTAVWLDLKVEGLGTNRPVDDIWYILGRELKRAEVVPKTMPDHSGADTLLQHVKRWLDAEPNRRVLLLLDEADRFLESDSKGNNARDGFSRCARLKGLMDLTERRFKVVFAGLHNVLRTTRQENHPLAHLGEPLCIGPLYENGELREARALVEMTLRSLGYRFESPDLIMRILSQTNFYPSLIQLYCHQLLRHVTNPTVAHFDSRSSPPYIIRKKHVEEAYGSQDLRKAIRDRLLWTLQLDQRYEVIAYLIAHEILHDRDRLVRGFSVSWIRKEVLEWWWPKGFAGAAENDVRALLDEMVGLGVLRATAGHYTLRSPNVLILLGTEQEIEDELQREREPPADYEPDKFRARIPGTGTENQLSPLSAQQESELRARRNGVSIVVGCAAAGLQDLRQYLHAVLGGFFICVDSSLDVASFARELDRGVEPRADGTTLIYVPHACPWSEAWVQKALERINRRTSKSAFVRVVFAADPVSAWDMSGWDPQRHEELAMRGLTVLSLAPWHDAALRQWLEECGFGPRNGEGRERICKQTGNWPGLLYQLYRRSKADGFHSWEDCLQQLIPNSSTLLHDFGLDLPQPRQVLDLLVTLGDISEEELIMLGELPTALIRRSLLWADRLHLAQRLGEQWRLDPVVTMLLQGPHLA